LPSVLSQNRFVVALRPVKECCPLVGRPSQFGTRFPPVNRQRSNAQLKCSGQVFRYNDQVGGARVATTSRQLSWRSSQDRFRGWAVGPPTAARPHTTTARNWWSARSCYLHTWQRPEQNGVAAAARRSALRAAARSALPNRRESRPVSCERRSPHWIRGPEVHREQTRFLHYRKSLT